MSTFPSPGLHHAGGLAMMSAYGTLPRPQLTQTYVPVMVTPSQGLLPPQSWATYMVKSELNLQIIDSYAFSKFDFPCMSAGCI